MCIIIFRMADKRKRVKFPDGAKGKMIEYIRPYLAVIEGQDKHKKDVKSLRKKREAWEAVQNAFASKYGAFDLAQLQTFWKRIVQSAKDNEKEFRQHRMATGGGPAAQPLDNNTKLIIELCPQEFVQKRNPFDDDNTGRYLIFKHILTSLSF